MDSLMRLSALLLAFSDPLLSYVRFCLGICWEPTSVTALKVLAIKDLLPLSPHFLISLRFVLDMPCNKGHSRGITAGDP